jgi:hypothetical protein
MVVAKLAKTFPSLPQWGIFAQKFNRSHCTLINHKTVREAHQPSLRQPRIGGSLFSLFLIS